MPGSFSPGFGAAGIGNRFAARSESAKDGRLNVNLDDSP